MLPVLPVADVQDGRVNKRMEGKLQYIGAQGADTRYYNLAQDLAATNARNEEITDREGHLFGYWVKVTLISTASDVLTLATVPNTWKVRNAFRKFHFARERMFRDAGVTKREMGKYGRTIRPYFSQDHETNGSQALRLFNVGTLASGDATGGEWTYSTLASSPTLTTSENLEDTDLPGVDHWTLTILGSHKIEATSSDGVKTWSSVSMVQAYNQDRMEEIPDATADSSIVSLNNPLASLETQTLTSGEITEIAQEQQYEEPPYDISDAGDSTEAVSIFVPTTANTTPAGSSRSVTMFVPAGILAIKNLVSPCPALDIEVLGKDLCKDVA